jgi:hypothetical protein
MSRSRIHRNSRPWDGLDLRAAAAIAVITMLALGWMAFIALPWDAPLAGCMVAYENARTAQDTAAVDVMERRGKAPFRERCGDFRRNGTLAEYEKRHGR